MHMLYIIGALWLFILLGGLVMLGSRLFRLTEVARQFSQGLSSLEARPVKSWMVF